MNRTVIILTIILTFGFTSSGVWANSGSQGFTIAKNGGNRVIVVNSSGGGAFPPDKSNLSLEDARETVVYGNGGGGFPPDKEMVLTTKTFCLLGFCLPR